MSEMIKIAILDDSPTARMALRFTLESDSDFLVVGEASTGEELISIIHRLHPDLVAIDVYLHRENGLDVAQRIMCECPVPIVLVTAVNPTDSALVYAALERGVLDVFPKLPTTENPSYRAHKESFLRAIKSLASVPVLHRGLKKTPQTSISRPSISSVPASPYDFLKALLIGASTGGPPLIRDLLVEFPAEFPIPIVVIQHISEGFGAGFAKWLEQDAKLTSVLITDLVTLEAGKVYVAPDNRHIAFTSTMQIKTFMPNPSDHICPSINHLFQSAAEVLGSRCMAVLYTGMGRDGSSGLLSLKNAGAFTMVQDPSTCVVDSMPKNAIDIGAATMILHPSFIGSVIKKKLKGGRNGGDQRY